MKTLTITVTLLPIFVYKNEKFFDFWIESKIMHRLSHAGGLGCQSNINADEVVSLSKVDLNSLDLAWVYIVNIFK